MPPPDAQSPGIDPELQVLVDRLVPVNPPASTAGASPGLGSGALQSLRSLRERAATSGAAALQVLEALARPEARVRLDALPQAWMLRAQAAQMAGMRLPALQAWHQAANRSAAGLDAASLSALDLGSPQDWSARVAAMSELRVQYLQDAYSDIRRANEPRALFRIDRALAGYLGQASVFSSHPTQRPKLIFVPGLRSGGFLDPRSHPLVAPLLAAYGDMKAEFQRALVAGEGVEPFMNFEPGARRDEYVSGPPGASWDALFFFRHGRRHEANHLRFPVTGGVLDSLDLCRIDGQAPEICFSILQPRTRIEPHHGVTNARVVIHIPFLVPEGCHLELTGVGRHHWKEGEPLVFDDTFEHSAENPSGSPRGILLMDAWHPELTPPERSAFRAIIEAISRMEALPER